MRLPSRYKELVTVCLYQKLKDEIADLDENQCIGLQRA